MSAKLGHERLILAGPQQQRIQHGDNNHGANRMVLAGATVNGPCLGLVADEPSTLAYGLAVALPLVVLESALISEAILSP